MNPGRRRESLDRRGRRFGDELEKHRAHAGVETIRVMTADREHADAVDRHEHGRTHVGGTFAEQRVEFFRLQAPAQRFVAVHEFGEHRQRLDAVALRDQPVRDRQVGIAAEQHETHQIGMEILGQARGDAAHRIRQGALAHQADRERMHAHHELLFSLASRPVRAGAGSGRDSCRAALRAGSSPATSSRPVRAARATSIPGPGSP
jgi:hypothetical protein